MYKITLKALSEFFFGGKGSPLVKCKARQILNMRIKHYLNKCSVKQKVILRSTKSDIDRNVINLSLHGLIRENQTLVVLLPLILY